MDAPPTATPRVCQRSATDGVIQLVLAFGSHAEGAGLQAVAALTIPFEHAWREYIGHWRRFTSSLVQAPATLSREDQSHYLTSATVLRSMEDRTAVGATVASLSTPWGNTRNDRGGYHLVWSRDLGETAGALIAVGAMAEAQRTLAYLIASQDADGHWPQNQWVDGRRFWHGRQLDEAAYPILLAGALRNGATAMHGDAGNRAKVARHLLSGDAIERMVGRAAGYIARTGPATGQDRWEETSGLTASTLAPVVAALVVAADFLTGPTATYCQELADDWNASIEDWTYVSGTPTAANHDVDGYYARITASEVLTGSPVSSSVSLRNREPSDLVVPGDEMVGTDFLSLVRFGLRLPDDPRILSTLTVADSLLRTETPSGPVWHRYTGDGYGEHEDGAAYDGTGIGRGWPLLVGERGHYELAAGRDARPYLAAMRAMGSSGGMLPEQVWDAPAIPGLGLWPGRPSGSAMPLAWAHAEYLKLARSIAGGSVVDRPERVWERYHGEAPLATRALWRFDAARPNMPAGRQLRVELLAPARVHYSTDGGQSWSDVDTINTGLGIWVADISETPGLAPGQATDLTFWWPRSERWEGRDFHVDIVRASGHVG